MTITGMVLGFLGDIAAMNPIFLFVVFLAFIFIAYKVFRILLKAVIVGVIAAFFPFFAQYIGVQVSTDLSTMLWFGTFGVMFVMVFAFVHGIIKAGSSLFGSSDYDRAMRDVRKEMKKEKKAMARSKEKKDDD